MKKDKIKVGWFTFTCCEGCAIIFIELLNDKFKEWNEKIEFTHFKILRSVDKLENLDLAIVEGAISTEEELEFLKEIREKSSYVMAVGACAITGMPAGLRNNFDKEKTKEIQKILKKFKYLPKVEPVSKFIKIDFKVPGCPMDENIFLKEFSHFIDNFKSVR